MLWCLPSGCYWHHNSRLGVPYFQCTAEWPTTAGVCADNAYHVVSLMCMVRGLIHNHRRHDNPAVSDLPLNVASQVKRQRTPSICHPSGMVCCSVPCGSRPLDAGYTICTDARSSVSTGNCPASLALYHASRIMHHPSRYHAPCTVHRAPCTMLRAQCTMHNVPSIHNPQ